ncbi:MAG: tRNA (N(6)-L-threonylcarbamoyladenosine(37)-C(2))-methylthiotransferase MtaB [Lachnospiraceae bacterium]|nr:tRNA (N(6)-L-threonylcarbamoyladenosine(37)-C(2))-methylthiotransferase MtaB [Lachnospiraceae bacterium]
MKNVAFHNLGCKVNSYELNIVQQNFVDKGYKIVPFDEKADIYIVNTCTVTNIADRKSRQMLHQAKARNPRALVVALGCYVQTGEKQVEQDDCIDLAIGNNRKRDAVEIIEAFLEEMGQEPKENGRNSEKIQVLDLSKGCDYEEMSLTEAGEHTRAYIKIQDGCNQFCSYCIIPFARGRVRSRRPEDIYGEIEALSKKGYKEFVLTGIHISSYGTDFEEEQKENALLRLIQNIHEIGGVERIRLGSLEPRIVTEEFVSALSKLPKICPHFHLSLQSGCDATLKRMNRHYTAAEYMEGVDRLRSSFQDPAITTDVIVGFPGETEEEFLETKAFLQEVGFFEMHIFPYSARKGTVAAKMKEQVEGSIKKKRSKELLELDRTQSVLFRGKFIGMTEQVLFEEAKEIEGSIYQIGHTARYVKVAKKTEEDLSGQLVSGKISGAFGDEVLLME